MPAISVLVPIYNVEAFLKESLDSLRAQTFTDFEVICINDGSTDASPDIIRAYEARDARFKMIDKPNSGYGASMNRGLDQAAGAYIAILEPDDFFEPDALEKLYRAATQDDVDVAKANYWFYWTKEHKNVPIRALKPSMTGRVLDPYQSPEIFFVPPTIWSGLYKKSYLDQHHIRFLETPGASFQDLSFTFKVWVHTHRTRIIENEIIHYRQDNAASSVNDVQKVACIATELDEIKRAARVICERSEADECSIIPGVVYRMIYDNYLWNFQRLDACARAGFLAPLLSTLKEGYEQGAYDPRRFHYYQQKNLEFILKEPERFLVEYPSNPSRMAKLKYYFKRGGFKAVKDIMTR
jgi:glycosyltransferase involved in cell wall biosynthesis